MKSRGEIQRSPMAPKNGIGRLQFLTTVAHMATGNIDGAAIF